MARRLVPLLFVACFAMLVFAFAGCGGDGDSSASEDTVATETTTTEETTEEEATEEEATEEETTEDTETTETSSSGDFASAENCEEFATIGAKLSEAVSGSVDVGDIEAAFGELAAAAPDDIKGDFETLATYMSTVAEALEGYDPASGQAPDPSALAKLAALDSTAATTASTNIATWVQENCSGQ
jgi:hypothetical protein